MNSMLYMLIDLWLSLILTNIPWERGPELTRILNGADGAFTMNISIALNHLCISIVTFSLNPLNIYTSNGKLMAIFHMNHMVLYCKQMERISIYTPSKTLGALILQVIIRLSHSVVSTSDAYLEIVISR